MSSRLGATGAALLLAASLAACDAAESTGGAQGGQGGPDGTTQAAAPVVPVKVTASAANLRAVRIDDPLRIDVADGTTLWVHGSEAGGGRDRLWRIDALDGRVLGSIDLPGFGAAGMATVGADAWIVTPGGQLIVVAAS